MDYSNLLPRIMRGIQRQLQQKGKRKKQDKKQETLFNNSSQSANAKDLYNGMVSFNSNKVNDSSTGSTPETNPNIIKSASYQAFIKSLLGSGSKDSSLASAESASISSTDEASTLSDVTQEISADEAPAAEEVSAADEVLAEEALETSKNVEASTIKEPETSEITANSTKIEDSAETEIPAADEAPAAEELSAADEAEDTAGTKGTQAMNNADNNDFVNKKISGCDVNIATKYDENGKEISKYIRIIQKTSGNEYQINSIPDGLDVSKITKVSSNKDGTFTVTVDNIAYIFNRSSAKDRHFEYDNLVKKTTYDENKVPTESIDYGNGFKTTHTYNNSNGRGWTEAIREYDDGCKIKYSKTFNEDGTYTIYEKKFNKVGTQIEDRVTQYDKLGRITKIEESVGGYYDTAQSKYIGGQYNVRERFYDGDSKTYNRCTRIGYSDKNMTEKIEEKQYNFLDNEHTKAIVSFTQYKNGEASTVYSVCHFVPNEKNCKYRYFMRTDGCIEIWHYDGNVRTEVTVTHPDGENADGNGNNHVTRYYNSAGEKKPDTWSIVNINNIENEYGKEWAEERQNLRDIINNYIFDNDIDKK